MLAAFAVPYAHFRAFQTPDAASDPLTRAPHASSLRSPPADTHLREFAALETQCKALQQQLPPRSASASTSNALDLASTAQYGAIAECLLFYRRLMTAESLVWPDFLATVCTKLTEYFVAMDNEHVRNVILQVLEESRAHVVQVRDVAKMLGHVGTLMGSGVDKEMVLRLVECLPPLVQRDPSVLAKLEEALRSAEGNEQKAAIAAARRVLVHSLSFRPIVLGIVMDTQTAALAPLLVPAVSNWHEAQQAWSHCAKCYHDQIDEVAALYCLQTTFALTEAFPSVLLANHLELARYAITNDPRRSIVSSTWTLLTKLISSQPQSNEFDVLMIGIEKNLVDGRDCAPVVGFLQQISLRVRLSSEVQAALKTLTATKSGDRICCAYARVLTNAGIFEMEERRMEDVEVENIQPLIQLIGLLHPSRGVKMWKCVLHLIEGLCWRFPRVLSACLCSYLLEMTSSAMEAHSNEMLEDIWVAISHIISLCPSELQDKWLDYLQQYGQQPKIVQAVVVCVLRSDQFAMKEHIATLVTYLSSLDHLAPSERYDLAKLAMTHGYNGVAPTLLKSIAESVDHECYGGWIRCLNLVCSAEEEIVSSGVVSMNAMNMLLQAKVHLDDAVTSSTRFDFQRELLAIRGDWMGLMLCAQQYAQEIAVTGQHGSAREQRLCDFLCNISHRYQQLRGAMFGASSSDLDVIAIQELLSLVVAEAIEGFLLLKMPGKDRTSKLSSFLGSTSYATPLVEACSSLRSDVASKLGKLSTIDPGRQAAVGAQVLVQLLRAVCMLPFVFPRQFFRSTMRSEKRLRSSLQFLTHAECASCTQKPRGRSSLGVAIGADFTCSVLGCLGAALPHGFAWCTKQVKQIQVDIELVAATSGDGVDANRQLVVSKRIPVDLASNASTGRSNQWCYATFEFPLLVRAKMLQTKGSYSVEAKLLLIDENDEQWQLAPTGPKRGIIVY